MKIKTELLQIKNSNPVISVAKDGIILYSNEAGETLLREWRASVGEKLPSDIGDFIKMTISQNNPINIEVNVGKKVYKTTFYHFPEDKCVNIYGLDISDQKLLDEKVQECETKKVVNPELSEIIDIQAIQSLMDDFYKFVQIPMSLKDIKGNVLVGVGWQDICSKFHRTHPDTCKHCIESSTNLYAGIPPGEFKLFRCKNNMWNMVTPIIVGGHHVGNIFSGQFFLEEEPLDYDLFRSQARKYGFNEEKYLSALKKVPRMSRESVEMSISYLMKFANMFSQLSYSNTMLIQSLAECKKAEDALKKSEGRYRMLFTNMIEAFFLAEIIYGKNGKPFDFNFLEINPAFELQTGIKREKILGKSFLDVSANTNLTDTDNFLEVALSGKSTTFEMFSPATGKYFEVYAFIPEKGKLAAIFKNITDRKQMEEALRKNEEKYRNIVETSNESIIIIDNEAKVTYANKRLEDIFGYSLEEVIGKSMWDFISEESKAIVEKILENEWQTINENLEIKLICKDDSFLWALVNAKSLFDKDGKIIGIIAMLTDITERKNMEEALRNNEEKYRNIVETSNEGISLNDGKGLLTYANRKMAEMLGYDINEIIGRNILDFVVDIDDSVVTNSIQNQLQDNIQSYDFKLLRKDRSPLWVFVNIKSFFDEDGKFIGSLNMFTDITERKNAEMKLKETLDNLENSVKERTSELETAYNLLKEGEKSLAEAQRMARIGNWDWNLVTNQIYFSDELYRIFGLEPQTAVERYESFLFHYVHPDDCDYVNSAVEKALKGEPSIFQNRVITATGDERIIYSQTETVFDEKNRPIRVKAIVQDVTERKKAEERIRNLANIVESSNDAIGTTSPEGTITSWNKGAEDIYGYSQEEIVGKHVSVLAPYHLSDETKKRCERVKQGESIRQYETLRLRKDGKIINVSITLSPVFDSHGKMTDISFISRDITEKTRAEGRLRESEEKYRNIVETANEGIVKTDSESVITYVNLKMADMLGYTVEELIGRTIWDFISDEYRPIIKTNLEKRKEGISESIELKLIHKNSSHLWTHMNSKALFDKEDKYLGAVSMLTDITSRKEAEQALLNFEIAREKEIHHRIKNNLQVVSSLLDFHAFKFKGRNDIKDSEVIDSFRESKNRVISMALIHEELYRGRGVETINFSTYVEKLANNLLSIYRLGNTDINLIKDIDEDLFFDMDTAIPLGTIINELVSNSFKHAFPGRDKGEVRIILHREEKKPEHIKDINENNRSTIVILIVSDDGIGIPRDLNIQELDSLGLQLITTLVNKLSGELELKSSNGTEFIIRFTVTKKGQLDSEKDN